MDNKKSTKRALLSSVLSLVLCMAMLIGTTFAWFTDDVTSAGNKIQAGTLKIDLELLEKNADGTTKWTSIKDSQTPLFTDSVIWEPGYTDVKILKVENEGNLALKWYAKFISNFELSSLADVIDVYVCPSETTELTYPADRSLAGYTKAGTLRDFVNTISTTTNGVLLKEECAYLGIALKMQESAGNEYQGMDLGGAFDIQIFATQYTHESDSFDSQYDKGASWTGATSTDWYNATEDTFVLTSAEELAGFAKLVNNGKDTFEGKTVKLGADIDLNDISWTPIGNSSNGWKSKFGGTFIGTGYTISNLYVNGTKGVGLFGYVGSSAHIEGITIDGAYVAGNDYVGAVMGTGYLAANCLKNNTVKNATIIATPYLMNDGATYDGGAKAGAIAGSAYNGSISGNKAINCHISAYRDLGSIVGMAYAEDRDITVTENCADTVTLTYLSASPYVDNKVNENMGEIVGRRSSKNNYKVFVEDNNTVTNVIRETVVYYIKDDIKYMKDVDANQITLLSAADYKGEALVVPNGVTALGNGAFSANTTIKTVTISATVTDFGGTVQENGAGASGGAFKNNNSIETVILSEGMTEIPASGLSQAKKITSVNIPSTVTKVGVEAFEGVTLEELTIPATVTEIGHGAFRGMSELTTVTITGSPVIANYAFRSCAKLKYVYLVGANTTFSGTSQVFTNNDHTNNGVVNVFVANETVKQGLLDATSNDASLNITLASFVSNATELTTAVSGGATNLVLAPGEYNVNGCGGKTLTINGNQDTVLVVTHEGEYGCDYGFDGSTVTFNNVTFNTVKNNSQTWPNYARMNGSFSDCTFVGSYAPNRVNSFTDCTFNVTGNAYNLWLYGASDVTMTRCILNCEGKSIYVDGNGATGTNLNLTSCVFNDSSNGESGFGKAAIETGKTYGQRYELIINDIAVNGFTVNPDGLTTNSNVWANKHSMGSDKLNVVIDGTDVY